MGRPAINAENFSHVIQIVLQSKTKSVLREAYNAPLFSEPRALPFNVSLGLQEVTETGDKRRNAALRRFPACVNNLERKMVL